MACQRSLMGAHEQDLARVLGQRESVMVGAGQTTISAPWGPALAVLLEQALNEEIESLDGGSRARPDNVPMPTRAMFGPRTPQSPTVATELDTVIDDLAETTRQQLTKMYNARVAAPARVEADSATPAARTEPSPPPSRATERPRATERVVRAPRPGRRKVVIGIVLLVTALLGVRYVRSALASDAAAAVRNPSTPVDNLPWRTVRYGDVLVELPTKSSSATLDDSAGISYRYDRYVLPDVTFTVTVRAPNPTLVSDSALRSYSSSVAGQLGGRMMFGLARDVTFGTSFSASLELPDGPAQMYVLSSIGSVIELQADIPEQSSGRALKIYERVIRSFAPA